MTENVQDRRMFYVDPRQVAISICQASFGYCNTQNRQDDVGFGQVAVFPILYEYITNLGGKVPYPDDACMYLMEHAILTDGNYETILNRARKMTLDFYRELHALGLLITENKGFFSVVYYQKGLDIGSDVDVIAVVNDYRFRFVHRADGQELKVGVQVKMIKDWKREEAERGFLALHNDRRQRRGDSSSGLPIFYLTNRDRPRVTRLVTKGTRKNGGPVWVFTPLHIRDLINEIKQHFGCIGERDTGVGPMQCKLC